MVNNVDETIASRNGAHASSHLIPVATTRNKRGPVYTTESAATPERTALINQPREDSPPRPERKPFGDLYGIDGELFITFVHSRFAYTLVMPQGYQASQPMWPSLERELKILPQ